MPITDTEPQVEISGDSLYELTRNVWSTLLGGEIRPQTEAGSEPHSMVVTGCVEISGAWRGLIVLQAPPALGRRVAASMMGVPPEEIGLHQIYDAFGELANIVGGNIKGLLPGPSQLSLPTVDDASAGGPSGSFSRPLCKLRFAGEGGCLTLEVLAFVPKEA